MLLEFKAGNYKSFREEQVFSMVPASKQKGLDYSLLKAKINGKEYKGLCSSVIYGANAAGKTNLIGAMDTFRSIVLRGHIHNIENDYHPNVAGSVLNLIPNKDVDCEPISFSVNFIEDMFFVNYHVEIDLGCFMDMKYHRKVLHETLTINGIELFDRRERQITLVNPKRLRLLHSRWVQKLRVLLTVGMDKQWDTIKELSENSLNEEELFLANGFRTIVGPGLARLILDWFKEKLLILYRSDAVHLLRIIQNLPKENPVYIDNAVNGAAEVLGVNSKTLAYIQRDKEQEAQLCSVIEGTNSQQVVVPADIFESFGTVRFANLFPLLLHVLQSGGILVADEFDASLHPKVLMSIISLFHNDEINTHHAQLVFNTHNPIFLNSNLFRRDEIKFVERDEQTHFSSLYALSDFGTAGKSGVRKNEDYMNNYFVDRYGAIRDVDDKLVEVFVKAMESVSEEPLS